MQKRGYAADLWCTLKKGLNPKASRSSLQRQGAITALVTGNMVQANSIAAVVKDWVSPIWMGVFLSLVTGIALFGGIKSIGKISSWLVPTMAGFYILGGLVLIALHLSALPAVFKEIFLQAFSGKRQLAALQDPPS